MQRATCCVILCLLIGLVGCANETQAPLGSATTTTTLPADLVLGQGTDPITSFTKNDVNLVDAGGFFGSAGIAVDSVNNRLYVADAVNNRILGFSSLSALSTNGTPADIVIGQADLISSLCNRGGTVSADTLCHPRGVAVDNAGNLYVADTENNRVLAYDNPAGTCSTCDTTADHVFGQLDIFVLPDFSTKTDNAGGLSADSLSGPKGVAIDKSVIPNRLYIADTGNNRVLEYDTPLTSDTTADHVFGQGDQFTTNDCNNTAPQVGNLSDKSLCRPEGIAIDNNSGNVYIADTDNSRVLEYDTPLSTDTTADHVFGQSVDFNFTSNDCNAPDPVPPPGTITVSESTLCRPVGVAFSGGNLYVADTGNNRVLEYDAPLLNDTAADHVFGQSSDFNFSANDCNTPVTRAVTENTLCGSFGVALDSLDNLYVADTGNSRLLKYTTPLITDTTADLVLGQGAGALAFTRSGTNFVDAVGLNTPKGIAVDPIADPDGPINGIGVLYVADTENNRVLGFSNLSALSVNGPSAIMVIGQPSLDFNSNLCDKGNKDSNGLSVPDNTTLCRPRGVAVDSQRNLYVADTGNNRVLEFDNPFGTCGTCDTTADRVFGQGDSFDLSSDVDFFGNPLPANRCNNTAPEVGDLSAKSLCFPVGVALDSADNLYVADTGNSRVLEYDTPLTTNTTADRVFGQGNLFNINECNNPVDVVDGLGPKSLCFPEGVALDTPGNLYVADTNNHRVLEYDTPLTSDRIADRVFGQGGSFNFSSDLDSNGNLLLANRCNNPAPEVGGLSSKSLCSPRAVAVDSTGNLYVADTNNNRVLEYDNPFGDNPPGTCPACDTIADEVFGQPDFTSSTCNNPTPSIGGLSNRSLCFFTQPAEGSAVALDGTGNLYVADTANHRVLRFP